MELCHVCRSRTPKWVLERSDGVTDFSCNDHLASTLRALYRGPRTTITVTPIFDYTGD